MTDVVLAPAVAGAIVESDPILRFTEEWLANRRFSDNTREAYRRDVRQWLRWCDEEDLDPLQARFTDVNAYARELEHPDGGKPAASATVARKISSISSWYAFLVKLGRIAGNPAAVADRPDVDRDYSSTVAFTHEEAARMLTVSAEGDDVLGEAAPLLAAWMVEMGTRATETGRIDLSDLSSDRGFQIVQMVMKGGRRRSRTIPPPLVELKDRYLAARAAKAGLSVDQLTGPLFVTGAGKPLDRHGVYRFVQRLAKAAGLPNADRITPHSFRHAWNTMARARGADLEDRQYAMGHRDPRTTRRYDRSDGALERDPSLLVAAAVARRGEEHAPAG